MPKQLLQRQSQQMPVITLQSQQVQMGCRKVHPAAEQSPPIQIPPETAASGTEQSPEVSLRQFPFILHKQIQMEDSSRKIIVSLKTKCQEPS